MRIKIKYLLPILLISMVMMQLLYFVFYVRNQHNISVLHEVRSDIQAQMARLQGTINFLLRTNNFSQVSEEISSFATDTSVQTVLLFDANQLVLASIRRAESGQVLSKVLEKQIALSAEQFQQQLQEVLAGLTGRIWETHEGLYTIGLFPVRDFQQQATLRSHLYGGVLVIHDNSVALGETEALVWRQSLHLGSVITIFAIFLGILLHFLITRKTGRLMALTQSLSAGDYQQRYGENGHTELDALGHAFDVMADKLDYVYAHLETMIDARTRDLQAAKQEAEQANRVKSDFLAHMSHELRTPLNAIIGFTRLLELEEHTQEQAEHLKEISSAGYNLLTLVSRILDLLLVEKHTLKLSTEKLLVKSFLVGIQDYFTLKAEEKEIQFNCRFNLDQQCARVDHVRLRQVFHELLTNAIRFTDSGGTVDFEAKSDGGQVNFMIKDSGIGMSKTELEHVISPFQRLNSKPGVGDGIGIGLSLCQGLLTLMETTLQIESRPGQGSCFSFSLPLDTDEKMIEMLEGSESDPN